MNEIINKCSDEQYNAITGYERHSDIKNLETVDGMEKEWERRYGEPPDETRAKHLEFGTSLHVRLLEGRKDYSEPKDCQNKTTKGDRCKRKGSARNATRWYCTQHQPDDFVPEIRSVTEKEERRLDRAFSRAEDLYRSKFGSVPHESDEWMAEAAIFGEYEGMPLKVKIDSFKDGILGDVKTISNWPEEGKFLYHIWKYKYDISGAGYINVALQNQIEVKEFWWLFVESVWPHRARWVQYPYWLRQYAYPRLEKCYQNMMKLREFVAPTEVELKPEDWLTYKYDEEVSSEGVEVRDHAETEV